MHRRGNLARAGGADLARPSAARASRRASGRSTAYSSARKPERNDGSYGTRSFVGKGSSPRSEIAGKPLRGGDGNVVEELLEEAGSRLPSDPRLASRRRSRRSPVRAFPASAFHSECVRGVEGPEGDVDPLQRRRAPPSRRGRSAGTRGARASRGTFPRRWSRSTAKGRSPSGRTIVPRGGRLDDGRASRRRRSATRRRPARTLSRRRSAGSGPSSARLPSRGRAGRGAPPRSASRRPRPSVCGTGRLVPQ